MRLNYNYLPEEFAETADIFADWVKLIKSTDFTLGHYVDRFEHVFAEYVGVKYCIATNNGTDALILSLKALGIGAGDQVITVANTFYATVGAIVAVGATPVLVDCDSRYQISPESIEDAITAKTKAIMPVHWGGASPMMSDILSIADKYQIEIVEDACMGIGAMVDGKHPGTFGRVNAFSMHPLKSLNVMGDGGMVVTNDARLNSWMRKYRNHGMIDRDTIEFWGVNMRLQPLQAIVAEHRLRALDDTIIKRTANAELLDKRLAHLSDKLITPRRVEKHQETYALYMCLAENRDELVRFLSDNNIETKIHYPVPLNQQPAAKTGCLLAPNLENVNMQAKKLITLPVHQYLSSEQIEYMAEKIQAFYG